jgi:hypothetical protein
MCKISQKLVSEKKTSPISSFLKNEIKKLVQAHSIFYVKEEFVMPALRTDNVATLRSKRIFWSSALAALLIAHRLFFQNIRASYFNRWAFRGSASLITKPG